MAHRNKARFERLPPRTKRQQGGYGHLRPRLEGWRPEGVSWQELDSYLLDFANRQMIEQPEDAPPGTIVGPRAIARNPRARRELDERYRSGIPAGYTYFGQFIDHDMTFDKSQLQVRRHDIRKLRNSRTPRLDLDCIYGRGPEEDHSGLYDDPGVGQGAKFAIGKVRGSRLRDLPRKPDGLAKIGDRRNDENAMVSQLHLAFLLAHNTLVDRARTKGLQNPFKVARRTLRWLYQYVVWNDFVRRVTIGATHARALRLVRTGAGRARWKLGFARVYDWKRKPFMPVEFSAAAYRFGHSMVRNDYQTNSRFRGKGKFVPLFDERGAEDADDLRGFRRMRAKNAIQWDWFLDMRSSPARAGFPQRARRIDTKLAPALAFLAEEDPPMNMLAYRNLKRGVALGLPAGTALARAYGLKPLKLERGEPDALWYYILREAGSRGDASAGNRLGALGSLIVCATFAGLLKGDPDAYVNADPRWTPDRDALLLPGKDNVDGHPVGRAGRRAWTLASIIRIAGVPVSARDFKALK